MMSGGCAAEWIAARFRSVVHRRRVDLGLGHPHLERMGSARFSQVLGR
jgi:hypothetical protein